MPARKMLRQAAWREKRGAAHTYDLSVLMQRRGKGCYWRNIVAIVYRCRGPLQHGMPPALSEQAPSRKTAFYVVLPLLLAASAFVLMVCGVCCCFATLQELRSRPPPSRADLAPPMERCAACPPHCRSRPPAPQPVRQRRPRLQVSFPFLPRPCPPRAARPFSSFFPVFAAARVSLRPPDI